MNNLKEILPLTQEELKGYLEKRFPKAVSRDGFLYIEGTVPVLLIAHLDTVHEKCENIDVQAMNNNIDRAKKMIEAKTEKFSFQ